jgi:short subunit dehydrogenase-like uncharacterized protein
VQERRVGLIVWGATGYTGRLVAEAVAARPPRGGWAIAGRDPVRLAALADELGGVESVVADAADPASLRALAERTRAIVSAVGPYARFGTALVDACVEAGTDLADLSGEVPWMRAMIDRHHQGAQARGVRIVHACGFDSVPSDVGAWLLQREARQRHARGCSEIEHVIGPMRGGVSGGTIASALATLEDALRDPDLRRTLRDPNALSPHATATPDFPDPWWPVWHPALKGWSAPFVMAAVNARVVRRTSLLLGLEPAAYRERWRIGGFAASAAAGGLLRVAPLLLASGLVRRVVARALPRPGEGPDAAQLAAGRFVSTLIGRVEGVAAPVVVRIEAALDPGYAMAARMAAAVGVGLADGAFDGAPTGVVTPAAVGGEALLARLQGAGIRFLVARAA